MLLCVVPICKESIVVMGVFLSQFCFKYECCMGHLFVLSWARVRRVYCEWYVCLNFGTDLASVLLYVVCFLRLGFGPICDACSWRYSFMGSVCVSSCRCCMFVSVVHPVAILSAVFCVVCSLLMFVSDAIGDHVVETYSSMGLVMALYVARIVSFCFPHVVDVSALSICIVLHAFVVVISMCLLYVSLGREPALVFLG